MLPLCVREVASFILYCGYCVGRTHLLSFLVLADFNKGSLSHKLPESRQHIKCPTEENTHDHCYTTNNSAYPAAISAALTL